MIINELAKQPKKMIQEIRDNLNLTNEETRVFDMLMKKYSTIQIADDVGISTRTVFRRINSIQDKLNRYYEYIKS